MYYLPVTIILSLFSIYTFYYTLKNRKEKLEKHLFTNELLIGFLLLLAGVLFPFMIQSHSPNLSQSTLDFLWIFTSSILTIEMVVLMYIIMKNLIISKKNPSIMAKRDYTEFCKEIKENRVYDLKSDIGRKLLHLFTVFVIFFFWILGIILENLGIFSPYGGLDAYSFAYWLTITIGFAFVIMFQIADLTRLNCFYSIPNWARNWYCKSMKDDEIETFVASTPMVLSFVPFIFLPFPLFATIALITAGADGAAAVIGMKFGNHKFNSNSKKTIEGYIAGGVSTFLIVIVMYIIFQDILDYDFIRALWMAIVATVIFLLVDAFTRNLCDNMLNPLLIGLGLFIIYII
jgi:dolichol kinase